MAKVTLQIEYDYDFYLLGIASHLPDYRLCWSINKKLDFGLEKTDSPVKILQKDKITFVHFDVFFYLKEETQMEVFLIDNINAGLRLIPEVSHADYLLLIRGGLTNEVSQIQAAVAEIDQVLVTFPIKVDELKSKQNLLF